MIVPNVPQAAADVAEHYDELDEAYRRIWGEHVHHGYWVSGRESAAEAADALTRLVGERLGVAAGQRLVDIGCGYGATAAAFARTGAEVTGFTLSAAQAAVARVAPSSRRRQARPPRRPRSRSPRWRRSASSASA